MKNHEQMKIRENRIFMYSFLCSICKFCFKIYWFICCNRVYNQISL